MMEKGRLFAWIFVQTIIGFWTSILILSVVGMVVSAYYLTLYVTFYALLAAGASLWIHSYVKEGDIVVDKWGI